MFGPLELSIRRNRPKSAGQLTNVRADGTIAPPESLQARFLLGNTFWHTDSSYKRVGAKASILAAHVVPDSGGETEWADMRAAYDVLDDHMKAWLEDKVAVHSYLYSQGLVGGLAVLTAEEQTALPPWSTP